MSSNICSSLGFVFVLVIYPKRVSGWSWVVSDFCLDIGNGNGDKGGDIRGRCGGGKYLGCCDKLNGDGGEGGPGRGGMKLLNLGEDGGGGGNPPLLLCPLNLLLSFHNAWILFCILKSTPVVGAFSIRSLAISFFPISGFYNKDRTIGFCASKVEMSLKTSSWWFDAW